MLAIVLPVLGPVYPQMTFTVSPGVYPCAEAVTLVPTGPVVLLRFEPGAATMKVFVALIVDVAPTAVTR